MRTLICLLFGLTLAPCVVESADLVVRINGIKSNEGRIGCSLHVSSDTFPMGGAASQLWQPSQKGTMNCVFSDLSEGTYAVAVSHDVNENGLADTNFLGIPKEGWGVSNNVRPTMRAPTFDEAKFAFVHSDNIETIIEINIE